jgi:hypothetical protein
MMVGNGRASGRRETNVNAGEPAVGWFMLSEADRSAAERYLSKLASDGTRDELGFAPIHFAFANRFFPGTSVQHAQLTALTVQEVRLRIRAQEGYATLSIPVRIALTEHRALRIEIRNPDHAWLVAGDWDLGFADDAARAA